MPPVRQLRRSRLTSGSRHGWTDSPIRQRIRLAFLSRDITAAILDGRQPPELTLQHLLPHPIPPDWEAQARVLGFPAIGRTEPDVFSNSE